MNFGFSDYYWVLIPLENLLVDTSNCIHVYENYFPVQIKEANLFASQYKMKKILGYTFALFIQLILIVELKELQRNKNKWQILAF